MNEQPMDDIEKLEQYFISETKTPYDASLIAISFWGKVLAISVARGNLSIKEAKKLIDGVAERTLEMLKRVEKVKKENEKENSR